MFMIDTTSLGACLIYPNAKDVVQWLGGDVWSPQVSWSNAGEDYVHLRATLGAISLDEK